MPVDDVVTQFFIDGAWTKTSGAINLDDRVRKNPGVLISRGTSDQQSTATAASSEFEVNNADGLFSNRNPLSPLYGKLPRYTKVRHYIPNAAGNLDTYARFFQPNFSGLLSTADKANIEITGDIDIRIDLTPETWIPINGQAIAGKYRVSGNNRAWVIWLDALARFTFRWSTDGTALQTATFNPWPAARGHGRQIMRITLDVDNGAAGWTATLMYGDTMSGPWTTHDTITTAGVTSIYGGGTAPLEVGNVDTGSPITGHTQFYGKIHAFQLRAGIGGASRAHMDAFLQTPGTTSWSDGLGNTWDATGKTRLGSDRIRHTGEIDTVQYRWDTTKRDVWFPLKSLGPLNRLQETGAPVRSPMYRNLIQYPQPAGYWPMEDGTTSTRPSQAAGDGYNNVTDVSFTGSTPAGLAGTAGTARLNSTGSKLQVGDRRRATTGENTILFHFKLTSLPASDKTLVTINTTGTVRRWEFQVGSVGVHFLGYNSSGVVVADHATTFGSGASPLNAWVGMQLTISQTGGNINYTWRWFGVSSGNFYLHNVGGTTIAGTTGRAIQWTADASTDAAFSGAEFTHVMLTMDVYTINTSAFREAAYAYVGELAGVRAARLALEEKITFELYGDGAATQAMGAQTVDTIYGLLSECATVDNAILFDLRDVFGIGMRTRVDMENQFYNNFSIPYGASYLSNVPAPVEDGRYTKNDMTVSRTGGGSSRATLATGTLSTQEPPLGIGFRPGTLGANFATDDQTQRRAEYELMLRTQDELRIPSLSFELHRTQLEANTGNVSVYERLIAAHLGDWVNLTGLPAFADPANIKRMIILGYQEQMIGQLWGITFNVATADGFRVTILDYMVLGDNGLTTLNASITTTATSAVIKTPTSSCAWAPSSLFPSDFPIGALIAGEAVNITALTTPSVVGSDNQQTATLTRSVNGVVKAHNAGTLVTVSSNNLLGL